MFMLWSIPLGILVVLAVGGRLGNLATFRFRWGWLAVAGLFVQVVLFTPTGDAIAGAWSPWIYLGSTLAVFVAVLRNLGVPGMWVVAVGARTWQRSRPTAARCPRIRARWPSPACPSATT